MMKDQIRRSRLILLVVLLLSGVVQLWVVSTAGGRFLFQEPHNDEDKHDQQQRLSSQHNDNTLAIFYNAFLPARDDGAYAIISEHIRQIQALLGLLSQRRQQNVYTLHYTTIGRKDNSDSFIQQLCDDIESSSWHKDARLHCNHLGHYDSGFEMVTQQILWEYCRIHPTHTVTYLHPKGSFHPSDTNSFWRRSLTSIALNPQCVDPPPTSSTTKTISNNHSSTTATTCNVCGGSFQAAWGPLFLGNMWTAQCDYVRKLIPPTQLEAAYHKAYANKPPYLQPALYRYKPFSMPAGRFAAEMFIGTHPSLMPCTVWNVDVVVPNITNPNTKMDAIHPSATVDIVDTTNETSVFTMLPPAPFPARLGHHWQNFQQVADGGGHRTEWFLLPGILWRSHYLYQQVPPPDSWMWWYYPEGARWQQYLSDNNFNVPASLAFFANQTDASAAVG